MRRRLLLLTAFLLFGGGCAFLNQLLAGAFKRPTLRFRSADLVDASLAGATLDLRFMLENPNPVELSLAELSYALTVEGHQVIAGRPPAGLRIKPRGKSELAFPAAIRFADLVPVVTVLLSQETAGYRAEGSVGVRTPIGVIRLPLAHEGRFEVPRLPQVQLGALRLTNLSLSGARLELPLSLTSQNSFPLPLGQLTGTVSLGGVDVGSVSTGELAVLEPRATRQVALPLTVNFGAAPALARALQKGSIQVGFNAQLGSGGASVPLQLQQLLGIQR